MLALLLYIAIVGLIAWAIIKLVPMPPPIQTVIIVVAVVACVIIALNAFGIHLPSPGVPQIH